MKNNNQFYHPAVSLLNGLNKFWYMPTNKNNTSIVLMVSLRGPRLTFWYQLYYVAWEVWLIGCSSPGTYIPGSWSESIPMATEISFRWIFFSYPTPFYYFFKVYFLFLGNCVGSSIFWLTYGLGYFPYYNQAQGLIYPIPKHQSDCILDRVVSVYFESDL